MPREGGREGHLARLLCDRDARNGRGTQDRVRGHEQVDARPSGEAGQRGIREALCDIFGQDRSEDGQTLDGHQPYGQGRR